jgi:SAM-dependent methyltransferase
LKSANHAASPGRDTPPFSLAKYESANFAKAQQTARARLYPSIFASNYMVLSNRRKRMTKFFEGSESVGRVLDVGAQYCPYYPLFKDKCSSYNSLDIVDTPLVDFVCNAEEMMVDDASFDLVLCTQVLEHCDYPQKIVDECRRVLVPGGRLIVTVPSVYPVHGYPADNWRFMPDGLRHLLREFSEVEVEGELDFPESLASVVCHYGHVFTGRLGAVGKAINPAWNCATNLWGKSMSALMRPMTRSNFTAFSMNLWALARK